MNKNTTISERITQVIDFLEVNPNSFAKKLGYDRSQALYDIINGKSKPSFDFFYKLYSSEYSEIINMEWLVTGKGEMEKSASENTLQSKTQALEMTIELMSQEINRLRKM